MTKKALVIGGGIEGVQAALDLADWGVDVTLAEGSSTLHVNSALENHPDSHAEALRFMPKLLKAASHRNINVVTNATVEKVKGEKGDFTVTISQQPRYVNVDTCTSCGRCEYACPVDIVPPLADAHDRHKAIHLPGFGLRPVPSAYTVEKKGIPPCTAACPAGVNVHGYVALVSQGKFAEALDVITEAVAFPRVLGRVCTHPCESECTRGRIDQPVAACALKRFAADNTSTASSLRRTQQSNNAIKPKGPPRVAIVGSGPAGLTAARDLARLGHGSTVFEALPVAGGMIAVGMPRFRLPREVRQADIDDILRLGIEIRTSTPIGPDLTLDDLRRQGYEAILIAVGAHKNQRLGILGEGLSGVINSIAFLRALNLKQPISVGNKVLVIGGGYTGIDSARTAVRLHCERVLCVDRCAREDLAANPEEVAEAEEEGVEFEYLVAAVRIVGQNGKVAGVEFRRMRLGERERGGRQRLIPIEGSEFFVEADTVIVAVGQRPDLSFLGGDTTLTEGARHIIADRATMATKVPGIFAAGDASSAFGPVINAIADGRRAALSIDRFLRGEALKKDPLVDKVAPIEVNLEGIFVPEIERQSMPCLKYKYRIGNFEEVELGFTARMAIKEAKRCLNCAGCSECLECARACELNAIDHNSTTQRLELEVDAIISAGDSVPDQFATHPGIYSMVSPSANGDLSQASAVAAKIMIDLARYHWVGSDRHQVNQEVIRTAIPEPVVSSRQRQRPPVSLEPRVGVFVCRCGGGVSEVVDVPEVVEYCQGLRDVACSREIDYACTNEAAVEIKDAAWQHNLTHVVLAACSCCNLDQICFSCSDRRLCCKANLLDGNQPDDVYYEFVNIREHCARVHNSQPKEATAKAKSLIRAGVARAIESQSSARKTLTLDRSVLVLGGGLSGMQAAADSAAQDLPTIWVSRDERSEEATPANGNTSEQSFPVRQVLESELVRNRATMLYRAKLINVEGTVGRYQATVAQNGKSLTFTVGTIIVDLSTGVDGDKSDPGGTLSAASVEGTELPPLLLKAFQSGNNRPMVEQPVLEPAVSRLPGVFVCGIGEAVTDVAEALIQGSAAASKASIWLSKGTIDAGQTVATIDQRRCRGCGTCVSICQFGAIILSEKSPGILTAQLDEWLCRGCGVCAAHCPSGALSQNGYGDHQLTASLEAILS